MSDYAMKRRHAGPPDSLAVLRHDILRELADLEVIADNAESIDCETMRGHLRDHIDRLREVVR